MVLRKLLKDSVIYGGADFVSKIVAFFTFPIIAAILSTKSFGILELVTTSTSLIGLLINSGINNSVQRFYWDESVKMNERPIVVSTGLLLIAAFGVIGLIAGILLVGLSKEIINTYAQELSWLGLISALFIMVLSQWQQFILDITRLQFAPWKFMSLSLISRVLGLALGVVVIVELQGGINGLLLVQALVLLAALPFALWLIKKDITFRFSYHWGKELFNYGYPFIYTSLAFWLLGSIDRWMLASMSSVEEVGIYSVAFRFASIIMFFSTAFGQAWSPYAIKIKTDYPNEYRKIYGDVLLYLLLVMTLLGSTVGLFSNEIVGLMMPKEYLPSAASLSVLCLGIILQSSQQITAIGISLEKKTYIFARLSWLVAILNILLNLFLIPSYGALGASWATTISYLIMTAGYLFLTQRIHPLEISWRKLLAILCLSISLTVAALKFNNYHLSENMVPIKLIILVVSLIFGLILMPRRNSN